MSGEYLSPEPPPTRNDWPTRGRHAADAPGPAQPVAPAPGGALAGARQAIGHQPAEDAASAGEGGSMAPAGVDVWAPPSPPGAALDPAAVTGPPWPRLVAAEGTYTPPRLIRWPIVVGVVLFAGWLAATAALRVPSVSSPGPVAASAGPAAASAGPAAASSPGSSSPYVLISRDAHFRATFPGRPQRTARKLGPITMVVYAAGSTSHGVAVAYLQLPPSASFSLNGGINGMAASLPGGHVISRKSRTYLGKPAEDATISIQGGVARARIFRFGSSAYVVEGFGTTTASFAHDYKVLLRTFTHT
jgi:hypothetical protein